MYKSQRENEIIAILKANGYVTVEYLARKLYISESSVRRDLALLESKGVVKRNYGGAELSESEGKVVPFTFRTHENINEKKKMAAACLSLVNEGDLVFVDGSSSCFFLLRELTAVKNITIVTNSVDGLALLSGYATKVISTGGVISDENRAVLVGAETSKVFSSMYADIAFFSAAALDTDGVIRDGYYNEISVRNSMLANCSKRVFLCDRSKINKKSRFVQGTLADVDVLVCDSESEFDFTQKFENVNMVIADK